MTFRASVERYLGAVAQQYHRGDAREESYYDVLKQLWEVLGSQLSSAHATLTVLPRQTEAGNPDMRVWSDQEHVTGYIECKKPQEVNLDHDEVSEQLKYYCCPSTTNNVARFEGSTSEIPVTCSQTPYYTSTAASTCNTAHPSEGAGCFFRRPFFFLTYHSELGVQCRAWSHSTMASSNRPSFSRSMIALV